MPDAGFALRKAIFARLVADAAIVGLIGPGAVFDEVPRGREPPYLAFGEGTVKDWSTSSDRGHEHQLTLSACSKEGGARQALATAAVAIACLEAMAPQIEGHRLVNLLALSTEVRRERERRLLRASIRLRAVTEVA